MKLSNTSSIGKCGALAVCTLILASILVGGCNDPYSRRRIAMREENLRDFGRDVQKSEARRAERLDEAGETLERWWARDSERWQRKWPTIPDYIW